MDVGTGAGHYALHLAQQNCQMHLIDLSNKLLVVLRQKFISASLKSHILSLKNASATHLDYINDNSVDAVLLFGPLYHLDAESERLKVILEAHRILKYDDILMAGGINGIAVLKKLWTVNRFSSI